MSRTALAAMSVTATVLMAGCGNAVGDIGPPAGLAGISVTSRGDYVIELFVCRDKVDTINISRDRQGLKETEKNPVVRDYKSTRPRTGLISHNLAQPGEGWTPRTPTAFESGKGYIVTGEASAGYDNETTQLNIQTSTLVSLVPGSVYVTEDNSGSKFTRYSPAQFAANAKKACG
ncbi:MAG: hypothetical protein H7288_25825 [Kineosporiaceae bacterium]|nr:hypothetical protein [Aeromicrobium sp.]